METKHTPGPWEVDERFVGGSKIANYRIFGSNQICELTTPNGRFTRTPAKAHATPGAPHVHPDTVELENGEEVTEAIAKATGGA